MTATLTGSRGEPVKDTRLLVPRQVRCLCEASRRASTHRVINLHLLYVEGRVDGIDGIVVSNIRRQTKKTECVERRSRNASARVPTRSPVLPVMEFVLPDTNTAIAALDVRRYRTGKAEASPYTPAQI